MGGIDQTETSGPPTQRRGVGRDFAYGVGLLGRGWSLCLRTPRLLGLGLIPVGVTALVFLALLVLLLLSIGDVTTAVTWFAGDWPGWVRTLVRVLAGVAIIGAAVLLAVVSFTTVALTIGEPFYERISQQVERWCGGAPEEVSSGFWRSLGRDLLDSARLLGLSLLLGGGLFLAGFLPAIGQTVVPVAGACVGG